MSAIKFYVKDLDNKTVSGVQINVADNDKNIIESFISGNRFKSINIDDGDYLCQIESADTTIEPMEFSFSLFNDDIGSDQLHPNVDIEDDKIVIHVTEQVITLVSPDDMDVMDDEPPMPENIDENNKPEDGEVRIIQKISNTTSIQIPSRKPIPIYISPTKQARQSLYVGGLTITDNNKGWYTVKYVSRSQGGRKTGYVKMSDMQLYLK